MMSLHHQILAGLYSPLKLADFIGQVMGIGSPHRLRVLLYHDIASLEQKRFAAQIRWLKKTWNFVTPESFAAMVSGLEPIHGYNLLLTLDDGFASNRVVAEQILNPMGIKAIFFVVSAFIDTKEYHEARYFISQHIHPGISLSDVPAHWRNMKWNDLAYLIETGHTIGAHARTHARLSELRQTDELEAEIIDSADVLEHNLGVKIEHFAYPFGNLNSFSPAALAIARRRFSFIYSGLRGDNACGAPPWALRRDAIAPDNSLGLVGALLEGGADIIYSRDIATFESWAKQ